MGGLRGSGRFRLVARFTGLAACSLVLANCSGGISSKIDPKYGVASSARVVEAGETVPKGGGSYRVGKPYTIAGRTYVPEEDINYKAEGMASWYGDAFHGRYTANGEIFDMNSISAAHPTMPLPSYARVTNLKNHRSIMVRVNDRGPFAENRVIDLSGKTAQLLGFHGQGLAKVKVEYIGRAPLAGSDDRKLVATLRDGTTTPAQMAVMMASNKPSAQAYSDTRPMSDVPKPPHRPFRATATGDAGGPPPDSDKAGPTTQLAANAKAAAAPRQLTDMHSESAQARSSSVVSAYAAVRNDGPAAFMSGRGLY